MEQGAVGEGGSSEQRPCSLSAVFLVSGEPAVVKRQKKVQNRRTVGAGPRCGGAVARG